MLDKKLKAQLILENGMKFDGTAFGYLKESVGEVIFYSGSAGYQETLTDPSFAGQIVVMTYPLVGNYGVNLDDNESNKPVLKGLVVRESCDLPNNWRCEMDLEGYLKQHKVMGIEGVDTRAITKAIRDNGAMKGIISTRYKELSESQIKQKFETFNFKNVVSEVTCAEKHFFKNIGRKVAVIDLGIKNSTIRELSKRDADIRIFPANANYEEIAAEKPDCIFVSSGPGTAFHIPEVVETVKQFIGKKPVFGIGLGHEAIALALGCKVEKLKYGHHGASYPVKYLKNGKVYITSQNHNYAVSELAEGVTAEFLNINDKTIEGIQCKAKMVYSVQFYPETNDYEGNTGFVYDVMFAAIEVNKEAKRNA